jgi:hypothetical protein
MTDVGREGQDLFTRRIEPKRVVPATVLGPKRRVELLEQLRALLPEPCGERLVVHDGLRKRRRPDVRVERVTLHLT